MILLREAQGRRSLRVRASESNRPPDYPPAADAGGAGPMSSAVDAVFEDLDHPLEEVMLAVREAILDTHQ